MHWKIATLAVATTTALLGGLGTSATPARTRRVPHGGALVAKIPVATPRDVTAGFGSIWVANGPSSTVTRIDPATDKVTAVIAVPNPASVLAVGAGSVWVTSFVGNTVTRINPLTNTARGTISAGGLAPAGITFFDGYVWVANHQGEPTGSVAKIDPRSKPMRIVDLIPLGHQPFSGPNWIAGGGGPGCFPAITRINPKSNTVTAALNTNSETDALALGAGALWYGPTTSRIIGRVDATTNTILGRLELPGPSFAATGAYGFVWVTDKQDNFLFQIRPT